MAPTHVLVTGATGFVGAHVVDHLLSRGLKVTGTTRSQKKAERMLAARSGYNNHLRFVQITEITDLGDAITEDIDGIIHCASPVAMKFENPEKEVLQPAISAVTSLLTRAATHPQISRVVVTSSAGALRDLSTTQYAPGSVYNSSSWNPATYASAATSTQGLYIYAASKALSERAAWDFVDAEKPRFTISTVIMPLVIGPPANNIESMDEASESAKILWGIAQGQYPNEDSRRVSPWCVDVYEVAEAHVQALLKPEAAGKRWFLSGPRWSLGLVKEFLDEECSWAETGELMGDDVRCEFVYEGEEAAKKLGLEYRTLEESLRAAFEGWKKIDDAAKEREMTGSGTDGM